mgnify:FL=1
MSFDAPWTKFMGKNGYWATIPKFTLPIAMLKDLFNHQSTICVHTHRQLFWLCLKSVAKRLPWPYDTRGQILIGDSHRYIRLQITFGMRPKTRLIMKYANAKKKITSTPIPLRAYYYIKLYNLNDSNFPKYIRY